MSDESRSEVISGDGPANHPAAFKPERARRRTLPAVAVVVLGAVMALGGCTGTDAAGEHKAAATPAGLSATVDIYSGRPNPHLTIGADAAGALTQAVDKLAKSLADPPAETGLGFRGVDVAGLPTRHGAASTARVTAHEVTMDVGGTSVRLADPDSTALKVIIDSAESQVDTAVLESLRDALTT